MKHTTRILGILAIFAAGPCATATAGPPDMKDVPLTLTGCVVAGEAKDSFLLTNVVVDGTRLAPADAFYRFNTTKGLKEQVGHRVEVKGKADLDDVDKGKVRTQVEDGKRTTEYTSERRTVKIEEDVLFGSPGSMKSTSEMATYRFEVDSVKRLAGNCEHSAVAR
jgi:hypothetical protein